MMKIVKFFIKAFFILLIILTGIYFIGPKPKFTAIDFRTSENNIEELSQIDSMLKLNERNVSGIRPDNEARIIWHNGNRKKTEYVLLYLPGFTASYKEGSPIHTEFAKRYGMNLYLPRLELHGLLDTNAFVNITPDSYFESAQQALNLAKKIGNKIVIMSCSTGGTLSIMLAQSNPEIHSFIMYSPNIDIKDPMSTLVTEQWGSELTSLVMGSDYNRINYKKEAQQYWYATYHKNGIIALKRMIKDYMKKENFSKINQPLYMGYYYKNEDEQDDVVSVPRMLEFFDQISTSPPNKQKVAFEDGQSHVICSEMMNKNWEKVKISTFKFAEEVLKLNVVQ
ncbi:MAG: hypothetical protein RLZZ546_2623 [Bacteroidota bacterium]